MTSRPIGRTQLSKLLKQGGSIRVTIPAEAAHLLEFNNNDVIAVRPYKGKKGKFAALYKFEEKESEL